MGRPQVACPSGRPKGRGRAHLVAPRRTGKDQKTSPGKGTRGLSDRPDVGRVPARREPQHAHARRRAPAVQEARGSRPQLRPRDVRELPRRRRDRAAVPQAPATARSAPPASWSGSRTRSSTSSTTSGTARSRSPAGSASCSSSARDCTAPGSPGSAPCGRRTSSRASATAGSRCTPRPTTPSSTASPRCGSCRACSPPTAASGACQRCGAPSPERRRAGPTTATSRASRTSRSMRCARRWASPPRPSGCPVRW